MSVINRAAVLSSLITIISIARLLIVSNYQAPVAIAIAYSNGTVSTLTGTLVPLVPLLLPLITQLLALSALVAMLHKKEPAGSKVWHALLLAATIAFMATMLVAPTKISIQEILQFSDIVVAFAAWSFMAFVLLLFIVGAFIRQWMKEEKLAIAYASILGLVAITVAVPIFADYSLPSPSELRHVPDVLRRVWLPAELIGLSNGSERVGYVLKTDGNWTTILWDSDRSVEITRTSNIANRVICRIGRPDGLPLILVPLAEMPKIRSCEIPLIEHPLMPPPRVRLP